MTTQPAAESKIQSPNYKIDYSWLDQFSDREQALIAACRDYAADHAEAGLPGHYLMLTVANLASLRIPASSTYNPTALAHDIN
jgi:hypothetical protein